MEILDEFDNESPLYVSFCKRISPEDFQRESLTYTEKALQDLYLQMECNPRTFEKVVQKRKQLEKEKAGLTSYMKAKFFSMFNGSSSLEKQELQEEVKQLKREMQKVSDYVSAPMKCSLKIRPKKDVPLETLHPTQHKPPDVTISAMPKIFGPVPDSRQAKKWMGFNPVVPSVNPNSPTDAKHFMLNSTGCHSSFLGSNAHRVTSSSLPRAPASCFPSSSQSAASASSSTTVFNFTVLPPPTDKKDKKDKHLSGA